MDQPHYWFPLSLLLPSLESPPLSADVSALQRAMLTSQIEAAKASIQGHVMRQQQLETQLKDSMQNHGEIAGFLQKKLTKNYEQIADLEVSCGHSMLC